MRAYLSLVTVLAINTIFVGCSNDLSKFRERTKSENASDESPSSAPDVENGYQAPADSNGGSTDDKLGDPGTAGKGNDSSSNGDAAGSTATNNATTGGSNESGGTGGSSESAGSLGAAGSVPTNPGQIRVRGGITTVQAGAAGSGDIRLVESALHVNPRVCDADKKVCVIGWFER
jgi:hypothetical protein